VQIKGPVKSKESHVKYQKTSVLPFFNYFFFTLAISQGFNPCQMLFVSKKFKIRFSKGLPLADVIFITGVHAWQKSPGK
jgi:hypothetical protein